ncbi:hypothetical protein [Halocatena marina]|nr:hypothetical protein [Halocatena marina]
MQTILAESHCFTTWELERSRLEQLLHRIAEPIEQHQATFPGD